MRSGGVPGRASALPGPALAGIGRQRKIAILGNAYTLIHAPWDDPSWELWAHTSCKSVVQRQPDRYFDLHPKVWWEAEKNWKKDYVKWLSRTRVPILMQEKYPEVPASVQFPKARILAEFPRYFTSQTAWMIALALTEGVTHLGFFGIHYAHFSEYATQRAGCEFWIGFAQGRGVQIVIPEHSPLTHLPKRLYGYESHTVDGLHEEYTAVPQPKVKGDTKLSMVAMDDPTADRIPLRPPPNGEPIAWDRSGHTHKY